jgi:hypothetical protein
MTRVTHIASHTPLQVTKALKQSIPVIPAISSIHDMSSTHQHGPGCEHD